MIGSFALLFTDVVDSTQLSQQHGDAVMGPVWARHDAAARELIRGWHGREIGRSDGFLVLFSSALEATGFALAYHRVLAALEVPMKARVGLHVGPLSVRENSPTDTAQGATVFDAEGAALPVAQRVMSAALGGQTLLSAAAMQALGPHPYRLQSHGHWRFKGLAEPIEVFEACEPGRADAPLAPPPDGAKAYRVIRSDGGWLPARQLPHNLPAERDPFIGRHDALHALAERLDGGARLVTVFGTGGVGKTRLALRYASVWLGEHPGGAWFCDLSSARTLDGLVHAVAQGLDVPLGVSDPVQQLCAAIAGRGACVVILDNFEQVAQHAERTLGVWLERAPEARFIATSREVLNITGEEALVLPPLATGEAVQMFRQRVRAMGVRDNLLNQDETALEPLVNLLDCLPLAIELAAVRVRLMPPRVLLQRMGERFRLLAAGGGRRDRQATLHATLDWSWDLLSDVERAGLVQLAVFEDGFSLDGAEAVVELGCGFWSADVVQALVEKSWLRLLPGHRYGLLRAAQEYALEKLAERTSPASIQERHWTHFAGFEEADGAACKAEIENLVVACRRAALARQGPAAVATLRAVWCCLKTTGPYGAMLSLIKPICACELRAVDEAKLALVAGHVHMLLGQPEVSRRWLDTGLRRAGELADGVLTAQLRCVSGTLLINTGRAEAARAELEGALRLAEAAGHAGLLLDVRNMLGVAAASLGHAALALTHYQAALALARGAGNPVAAGGLLGNIGEILFNQGELEPARAHIEQALEHLNGGHRRWEGNTRCNLGLLYHALERHADAAAQFELASKIARETGHTRLQATVLCNLGITQLAAGACADAVASHEAAVDLAERLGDPRMQGQFLTYLAQALVQAAEFERAEACIARGRAQLRGSGDQISLALLLCTSARLGLRLGNLDAARGDHAQALAITAAADAGAASELGLALRDVAAALHAA